MKDDSKHDPLLTRDRVKLMGIDPMPLVEQATLVNDYLLNIFNLIGMDLIDFKIELEYPVPTRSNAIREVRKCKNYALKAIAT